MEISSGLLDVQSERDIASRSLPWTGRHIQITLIVTASLIESTVWLMKKRQDFDTNE